MKLVNDIKQYIDHYDESELFSLLKSAGKKLGSQIVMYVLILVALIGDKKVPLKVRMIFMAAIGYLILPTDLIADLLPVIGFTDDIAFLTFVISSASEYITPEVKEKAKNKMGQWMPAEAEEDAEIMDS